MSEERRTYLLERAPEAREKDIKEIRNLFSPYLFIDKKRETVSCSVCGKTGHLPGNKIFTMSHERERHGWMDSPKQQRHKCPFCGKEGKIKEPRYCGSGKNLWQERRYMRFRWDGRALWAICEWASMSFANTLTPEPVLQRGAIYRITGKSIERVSHHYYWGHGPSRSQPYSEFTKPWGRPFQQCAEYGIGYDLIAVEEIGKSHLKYCDYKGGFRVMDPLEYIHFASVFPQKVEMLEKLGLRDCVKAYVDRGTKTVALLDWNAETGKEFLKLGGADRRELIQTKKKNRESVLLWRRLCKQEKISLEECVEIRETLGYGTDGVIKRAKDWGESPVKVLRYVVDAVRHQHEHSTGLWLDYIDQGKELGMKLYRSDLLLPANLLEAHDAVAKEYRKRAKEIEARKDAEKNKEYLLGRYKNLVKKYEFTALGLSVIVPQGQWEITEEGQTLKHCVAGYAERHVKGATTILFLRKAKTPKRSYITIEMKGSRIVQIHGYKNEMVCSHGKRIKSPYEKHGDFLDLWLGWVKAGSKRDKDGNPLIHEKGKKTA